METDELLRIVGDKDFAKNIKAFADAKKVAEDAQRDLGRQRDLLARRAEELDALEVSLAKRERTVKGRETTAQKMKETNTERAGKLAEAEAMVQVREKAAAAQESTAEERIRRAENLEKSAKAEKQRFERRNAHMANMPA
ncbi:MAG: hypothetical protein ACR2OV_15910 [Hyphomicrobiaceae bacterium]